MARSSLSCKKDQRNPENICSLLMCWNPRICRHIGSFRCRHLGTSPRCLTLSMSESGLRSFHSLDMFFLFYALVHSVFHSTIQAGTQESPQNPVSSSFPASNLALSPINCTASLKVSAPSSLSPAISHFIRLLLLSSDRLSSAWPSPHCSRVSSPKCRCDSITLA